MKDYETNPYFLKQSDLFKKGYIMLDEAKTEQEVRTIQRAIRGGKRLTDYEKEDLDTFAVNTIAELQSK